MKKILIVDDSPDFLDALSYILKKHYEVATAGGVEEAKEELLTSAFDVICSDYYMADGTGLDLLEFCKQEKISVPFILMSATREQHIVIEAKLHGAVFVEKTDSDFLLVIRENAD